MSGKRFQARAKTVQKLGRDGLVEQNMATCEEKRVSQRTADISFGPNRSTEQAAGHRAAQRGGGDPAAPTPTKKRRKQPRPVQQTAEVAREARAERQAEKKPSILRDLAEKKAEAAARSASAPEKEHKPQEAAL